LKIYPAILIASTNKENEMRELFLKTEHGLQPISEEEASKYNLKEGRISPFSRYWVVDKDGSTGINDPTDDTSSPGPDEIPEGEGLDNDQIQEFPETHAIMSQSEIIDFSHGTDSE